MEPWFIATKPFGPGNGETWNDYVAWAGLSQLRELVSLDENLCPTVLPDIPDRYWPHIVNEDFMLRYFRNLAFLLKEVYHLAAWNVLCVYRDPTAHPAFPPANFRYLGYDLVDIRSGVSALSNCWDFPTCSRARNYRGMGSRPATNGPCACRPACANVTAVNPMPTVIAGQYSDWNARLASIAAAIAVAVAAEIQSTEIAAVARRPLPEQQIHQQDEDQHRGKYLPRMLLDKG